MRILVVEDTEDSRVLLADQLKIRGYEVDAAEDGVDALHKIQRKAPDLIVSDILMPNMDGYELCRQIKQDAKLSNIPIIFYTATYTDDRDREFALSLGASSFVIKPARGNELIDAVDSLLGLYREKKLAVPDHMEINNENYTMAHAEVLARKLDKRNKELELQKQQLHTIADSLPVLISQIDAQHRFTYVNKLYSEWCKKPVEEIIGAHMKDVFGADVYNALRKFIERPGENHGMAELYLQFPDGKQRYVAPSFVEQQDENGVISNHVCLISDVTERKESQIELELYREQLEILVTSRTNQLTSINKELEAFCYSVSHDLRTPLRNISGYITLLAEDYPDLLDAQAQGYLERINKSTLRMAGLIDDLLKLSRFSQCKLDVSEVNVSKLAAEISEDIKQSDIRRKTKINIGKGLRVQGDEGMIRIVIENLLNNAWKFTSKQSFAEISVDAYRDGNNTVFYVKDNGAGFDSKYVNKLFSAFQRLHDEGDFPGTGIGLATVKRIVSRHGGKVWADGEPGKGACFYFSLPVAAVDLGERIA